MEIKYGIDGVGGICGEGSEESTIEYCVNYGRIAAVQQIGGIVGCANLNSSVRYCYNRGEISSVADYGEGGICGVFGHPTKGEKGELYGCYNTGKVTGKVSQVGGVSGFMNCVTKVENIINCGDIYFETNKATSDIGSTTTFSDATSCGRVIGYKGNNSVLSNYKNITNEQLKAYSQNDVLNYLGEEYIPDGKKIDKNGNIIDNRDSDGNIIYLNHGYPILKWQARE